MDLFGGIETGGTKTVCMLASGPENIVAEARFPTTQPEETLDQAIAFFRQQANIHTIKAIGVAGFGPLDLQSESPTYGFVTTTPKPGWAHFNIVGYLQSALHLPVALDTDVNAAALGEYSWGINQGYDPLIYFTIGTGIGGGGVINGQMIHGLVHSEMGHMGVPHNLTEDPYPGMCPYHGDCFEGLACGGAIRERWGQSAENLPLDHPAWDLEAEYISEALASVICIISPRKIVLGGGVMQKEHLFPLIRQKTQARLNGYIISPSIQEKMEEYIVPTGLGNFSGVLGAVALAKRTA